MTPKERASRLHELLSSRTDPRAAANRIWYAANAIISRLREEHEDVLAGNGAIALPELPEMDADGLEEDYVPGDDEIEQFQVMLDESGNADPSLLSLHAELEAALEGDDTSEMCRLAAAVLVELRDVLTAAQLPTDEVDDLEDEVAGET